MAVQRQDNRKCAPSWPLLLCAALIGLTAATAVHAQDKVTLRLGVNANSARNIAQLPYVTVQRKGFLDREGIEIKMVPLMGTTHMVDALDKGDVDVTGTASPYMIEAALKGSDAVAVIGGAANTMYSLIAKPEIKSIRELKGRVIAMSAPADTITLSTRLLLEKGGLKDGDYRIKQVIGSNQRGACLAKGECDAVPLGQPDDIVFVQKGYRKLGDSLEVIPVLQFNVIAARRAWANAHKDAVTRLARAFGATFKYLRDPANREEVTTMIADTTGAPAEVARAILNLYYEPDRGIMPRQAEINMPGMAEVIKLLVGSGQINGPAPDPERFVDLQYLHAAGLQ
jgi:ABC-type nitrate/sulfonate/bicarbonate transport system substrate-binding protein